MIYTCECCDTIFEYPETDEVISCPYCGRMKHDVVTTYGFATKRAVRKATKEEKELFLDPNGYEPPDHSKD